MTGKFKSEIIFNDITSFVIEFENLYDDETEKIFEWYFDSYIMEPYVANSKSRKCCQLLKDYGIELFNKIFVKNDLYNIYKNGIGSELKNHEELSIEIIGDSPEFEAIHWEALYDDNFEKPLCVMGVVIYRKSYKYQSDNFEVKESPVINLLVVTARSDEEDELNYRIIQRPLIDIINQSNLRVKPFILRPGTLEALEKHLDEIGTEFYHIIHFDLHGMVSGKKAYIIFEGKNRGKEEFITADRVSGILNKAKIPVCILNACQSAKQKNTNIVTSFGKALADSGLKVVIAMCYSISISAVELLIDVLYRKILSNVPIQKAIVNSRQELYNKKQRKATLDFNIELEDWVLPVIYKNSDVEFNLCDFKNEDEKNQFYHRISNVEEQKCIEYGFFGRDLDILKIEKLILHHNHLLLFGMGGVGKSSLINYLTLWWRKTNFVKGTFYFPYDKKPWKVEGILFEIARELLSEDELNTFYQKLPSLQLERILELLTKERYLLIFDNVESITGKKLSIQNALGKNEQKKLKKFLEKIKNSFVIYGSRNNEEWLKKNTFGENQYFLEGLDKDARYSFARNILNHINIDFNKLVQECCEFHNLMKLLSGYPLPMKVILNNLERKTVQQIMLDLENGNIDLDKQDNRKEESIIKCIEYAWNNLSDDAQKLLLILAPFKYNMFAHRDLIIYYFTELKKNKIFEDYPFDKFELVLKEAVNNGFMKNISLDNLVIVFQPVFCYYLNQKLNNQTSIFFRKCLMKAYINYMIYLSSSHYGFLNSNDIEIRKSGLKLVEINYENLYSALIIQLDEQEPAIELFAVLEKYLNLTQKHSYRLNIVQNVLERFKKYSIQKIKKELLVEYTGLLECAGRTYFSLHKYEEAKDAFFMEFNLLKNAKHVDKIYKGMCYQNLGIAYRSLYDYDKSKECYKNALECYKEYEDAEHEYEIYVNLGVVDEQQGNHYEALDYYNKALTYFIDKEDSFKQVGVYKNIASVYAAIEDYEKSMTNYKKAYDLSCNNGDSGDYADSCIGLSTCLSISGNYNQSNKYLYTALPIYIELDDKYQQAKVYHNLATNSKNIGDYEASREFYIKELELNSTFNDISSLANIYICLGNVTRKLKDYCQSIDYYKNSLSIFAKLKDEKNSLNMLCELIDIAEESGNDLNINELAKMINYTREKLEYFYLNVNLPEAGIKNSIKLNLQNNVSYNFLRYSLDTYDYYDKYSTYDTIDNSADCLLVQSLENVLSNVYSFIENKKLKKAEELILSKLLSMQEPDNLKQYYDFNTPLERIYFFDKYKPVEQIFEFPVNFSLLFYYYTFILVEKRQFDKALEVIDKALSRNPLYLDIMFEKAEIFKMQKRMGDFFKLTIDCFELSYKPEDISRCYRNFGYCFIETSDWDAAISSNLLSLVYFESDMAKRELLYISNKSGKFLNLKKFCDKIPQVLSKYEIPMTPNSKWFEITMYFGDKMYKQEEYSASYGSYAIAYNLSGIQEIKEKIDKLKTIINN